MLSRCVPHGSFSLAEARRIVGDLFQPKPWVYWGDFLTSWSLGGLCFVLVRRVPDWPALQVGLFLASCLLLYRAVLFIHEIVHFRAGTMRGFRFAWNMLCGVPFLLPSFSYYTHLDHHRRKHYGTHLDGEYLPLGMRPRWAILWYLLQSFFIPALVLCRFLVLAPISWISPRFRRWVQRRASSMVMDPSYVRPTPTPEELRVWRIQELGCFLVCSTGAIMFARGLVLGYDSAFPIVEGKLPLAAVVQLYLTAAFIVLLNEVRTLGAHRYLNDGDETTFVEQLVDSVNYPRWPCLSELWAPVGLRFHALHHLFPSLPYHNLPAAHRRLMEQLPADSPYRLTESDSLWSTIAQLWRTAGTVGSQNERPAAQPPERRGGSERGRPTASPRQTAFG
jgi:fatty acid desaturase